MKLGDLIEAAEASLIGIDTPGQRERGFLDIAPVDGAKAYALVDFLDAAQAEVRKYLAAVAKLAGDAAGIEALRATEIALVAPRLFARADIERYRLSAGQLRSMRTLGMIEAEPVPAPEPKEGKA